METFFIFLIVFVVTLCAFGLVHPLRTTNNYTTKRCEAFKDKCNENNAKGVDLNDVANYVYIDTETSSLEVDRGEVLQLSAIKIEDIDNGQAVLKTFNEYIKPSDLIRIDATSMKINGISLAKCKCPKTTAFTKFLEFCGGKILCGYNINFDIDMINDDMTKEGINLFEHIKSTKDVLEEVRNAMLPTSNNKLSTVSKYLGFTCDKYHNAIFDCLATMFVDFKLRYDGRIKIDFEEIANAMSKDFEDTCNVNDNKCKEFFNGKNVCISGDFESISRKYLEEKIIECGGIIKTGMSKRVNIFINGYNPKQTAKERKYEEIVNSGWDKIVKYNEKSILKEIS